MKIRLSVWVLLLLSVVCLSQRSDAYWQSRLQVAVITGFVCPQAYCGPGDIASGAIGFWSAGRSYNNAYAAAQSPLADLVDTATGLATCTLNVGTNGYANLTATVCVGNTVSVTTFCTVTHTGCSITKLYDQTGNGNHVVQATLANMPGLTLSFLNGLPCPAATGSSSLTLASAANAPSTAVPFTIAAVAERTGSFTTLQGIMGPGNSTNTQLTFNGTANQVGFYNGTHANLSSVNDNAPHALIAVASSVDPLFAADSSSTKTTSSSGTNSLGADPFQFMSLDTTYSMLAGGDCEGIAWPSDQNANYINLLANMRSATVGWNF